MAAWSTLYPRLLPHVPGVSDPLADQELRDAAQEFFRRTKAWKQWLAPITLTPSTSYALTLPTDSIVVKLEKATVNGQGIALPNWNSFAADLADNAAQGIGVTTADRINVLLATAYAAGSVLKLQAVLAPSDSAAALPDALMAQFGRDIVNGAKARLMVMPEQEFTDLRLAGIAQAAFDDAIGTTKHQAYKGFGNEIPRMRYRGV